MRSEFELWQRRTERYGRLAAPPVIAVVAAVSLMAVLVAGLLPARAPAVPDAASFVTGSRSQPAHIQRDVDLARLESYARSIEAGKPASPPAPSQPLPDVATMMDRLAARLETAPQDVDGWRMLGWSNFHLGRFEQAAAAYAKAVELDPGSAELKVSYDEAVAKASRRPDP